MLGKKWMFLLSVRWWSPDVYPGPNLQWGIQYIAGSGSTSENHTDPKNLPFTHHSKGPKYVPDMHTDATLHTWDRLWFAGILQDPDPFLRIMRIWRTCLSCIILKGRNMSKISIQIQLPIPGTGFGLHFAGIAGSGSTSENNADPKNCLSCIILTPKYISNKQLPIPGTGFGLQASTSRWTNRHSTGSLVATYATSRMLTGCGENRASPTTSL